jgi:uncharacterized C2H2 Zn-finger protein
MSATLKCPKCDSVLVEQGDTSKIKAVNEGREYIVFSNFANFIKKADKHRLIKCLKCNNIDDVCEFL